MKNKDIMAMSGLGILFTGIGLGGYRIYRQRRDTAAASFMEELDRAIKPGAETARAFSYDCLGLPGSKRLTTLQQDGACRKIKGAWGFFDDDEGAVYEALRSLASQEQFCQVNKRYRELYGTALEDEMSDRLSESEFEKVINIINSKPAYTV